MKYYYAGHSYMGLNYTYDSPCWMVYAFTSKADRDQWVSDNEYSQATGNYVAEAITADTARQIAPDLRKINPDHASRVIVVGTVADHRLR